MTQVNLLPSDVRDRQKTRRLTALVITGVAAAIALLFFVFVLQSARLASADQKLQAQNATNAALQSKIDQLQEFQQLKLTLAAREQLTTDALAGQILWSGVLRDISMVIPNKMWLTGMSGTVTAVAPPAPVTPVPAASPADASASPAPVAPVVPVVLGPTLVGSIQFQGTGTDHLTVAQWLARLEQVDGWANPWISSSTRGPTEGGITPKVEFTGTIDLTDAATVNGSKK